ncbi:MAG: cobalamin B12-binding domain-containing protein [Euzebyales bacterium]|nr:cobalamin B12-binding domain-containing protein [Euzebyales bacterium]MBA3621650.1 cobalamin B12-binding domain-containing protein [Euzebyales bacterium]
MRVMVAKPGLDGHDRGAKVVARALRDAGMEVIYLGLRQTPAKIAAAAVAEDVDVVGLSVLSGSHLPLVRKVIAALERAGGGDIPVVIGGTIPHQDIPALQEAGIAAVLPTSTPLDDAVAAVRRAARQRTETGGQR